MHTTTPTPPPQPAPYQPQWQPPPGPPHRPRTNTGVVVTLIVVGALAVGLVGVVGVARFMSGWQAGASASSSNIKTLGDGSTFADRTAAAAGVPTGHRQETVLSRRSCGVSTAGEVEVEYRLGTRDDPTAFVPPLRRQFDGWSVSDNPPRTDDAVGFTANRGGVRVTVVGAPGSSSTLDSSASAPAVVVTVRMGCS